MFQQPKARQIEMIHVRMREKNEIDSWKFRKWSSHFDQSLDSDSEGPDR
jgi:hypothetical protein